MVLTDSCCAVSMNEQVLTTITSASSARRVNSAPGTRQQAHHHLAVHQVLGAAQADEAHLQRAFGRRTLRQFLFRETNLEIQLGIKVEIR